MNSSEKEYFLLSKINNYSRKGNKVFLEFTKGQVTLEFLSPEIIRVVMGKRSKPDLETGPAVIADNRQYTGFSVAEDRGFIKVMTDKIQSIINKEQFSIDFYTPGNDLILGDYREKTMGWSGNEIRAWKSLRPGERFYGLGEKTGYLDKRGKEYTMWNTDTSEPHVSSSDPLYTSIPFLIGLNHGRAYGIYLNNSYKTHFDLGYSSEEYFSFRAEGGQMDYYFIYGPTIKDVVSRYTEITGKMPLPPRWSLGYHQSRYSYYPEKRVKELAARFREKEIPCDVIHLDIDYMDEYRVFTWDENRFPDPDQMMTELAEDGFKVVNIIDPGVKIDPEYRVYREGVKGDYFCKYLDGRIFKDPVWAGESAFPDFTKKDVRDWWAGLNQDLLAQGVKGIWNDMNEPAVFNENYTMDEEVIHNNDGQPGTHRRFHNLYAFFENMATYQGLKEYNRERPFVLSRAGFAGIQRYAAIWTGDNRSFWEHLRLAMPMLMNMGLSGLGFCGTDIGGFNDDTGGELMTRWMQLGTFMPFFRNHTGLYCKPEEPWAFGDKYEKIIKKYIRLRYKFMTYIYNQFYQAHKTGLPILRPLVMEFPADEKTHNLFDQFMVGEKIMIAPVYEPDREKRLVYLPEGEWIDYWSKESYQGNRHLIYDAPLSKLPLFIRAGSIIPRDKVVNYIGEHKKEEMTFVIYAGNKKSGKYRLYEDDGLSFAYQDGEYNLKEIEYEINDNIINISVYNDYQGYRVNYDKYKFIFNNKDLKPGDIVVDDNKIQKYSYDKDSGLQFKT